MCVCGWGRGEGSLAFHQRQAQMFDCFDSICIFSCWLLLNTAGMQKLLCLCLSLIWNYRKQSFGIFFIGCQASVCAVMGQWNWPDSCWYAFKSKQGLSQVVYPCKIHIWQRMSIAQIFLRWRDNWVRSRPLAPVSTLHHIRDPTTHACEFVMFLGESVLVFGFGCILHVRHDLVMSHSLLCACVVSAACGEQKSLHSS